MSWRDCWCSCHSVIPVDRMTDRVAAATACSKCKNDHVQKYVRPERPTPPQGDTSTSWQGDGEGSE